MQKNTKELCVLGLLLLFSFLYPVHAADNDTDFNATRTQVNQIQATDPTLPSGVSQPKGIIGDILAKIFNSDGKIGARYLSIFPSGSTTINPVYISGATITGLNATNITTGTLSPTALGTGVVLTTGDQIVGGIKTFTSNSYTQNVSPTSYFLDTDGRSAMLHNNGNTFYILRGAGIGSNTWETYNGGWPLQINLENNNAFFGGAGTFSGALSNQGGNLSTLNGNIQNIMENNWASHIATTYSTPSPTQHSPFFLGLRARGTRTSPTYPQTNDYLAAFGGRDAIDGVTQPLNYGGAAIYMRAEENMSLTNKGTYINFLTSNLGSATPTEKVRISANGNVGIGTTNPSRSLTIDGNGGGVGSINRGLLMDRNAIEFRGIDGGDLSSIYSFSGGLGLSRAAFSLSTIVGGTYNPDIYIRSDGNVGIGTNNPASTFHIEETGAPNLRITQGSILKVLLGDLGAANHGQLNLYNSGGVLGTLISSGDNSYFMGGNVGIGNISPTQRLDVTGNIRASGDVYASRICTSGGTGCVTLPFTASSIDGGGTANYVARFTDGNTLGTGSVIDTGTGVGIGTATPSRKLEVNGDMILNSTNPTLFLTDVDTGADSYVSADSAIGAIGIVADRNNEVAGSRIGFHVDNSNNTTPQMVINGDGNVGIGTATPTTKFEVGGARPFTVDSSLGSASLRGDTGGWAMRYGALGSSGTDRGGYGFYGSGDGLVRYYIGNYNTDEKISIPANGNVGIGNTTPAYKLEVNGTIGSTGNTYIENVSPTTYYIDTNNRSAMAHVNSNVFYILRGSGVGSNTWELVNGRWPLAINLENNNATFGGGGDFSGALVSSSTISSVGNMFNYGAAYFGDDKNTIQFSDAWLRLNQAGDFVNGTYTPFLLRADGGLQVGGNGSQFLVNNANGNVGIGTTAPVVSLDVRGMANIDQGPSYDVWVQGGSSTAGATRNLALLGIKSNDSLHLNYGGEYAGGTVIGSNVSIPGGNLTVAGNNIQTSSYCNTAGTRCKSISQTSEPDTKVAEGTYLLSSLQAAANVPAGAPASAVPDFWSYGGYYMLNTKVACSGRLEGGSLGNPKRYHPIVQIIGTVTGAANGFWWEDMEAVCLTRFSGPMQIHIKIKLEGNLATISGGTSGFGWELWED